MPSGLRALWLLAACLNLGCGALGVHEATSISLPADAHLLPARVRRLTNLELERSVSALTGLDAKLAAELPPDVRQEGYTPNANQDVSAAWATRYGALASELATRAARSQSLRLSTCSEPRAAACRASTVRELGRRALIQLR